MITTQLEIPEWGVESFCGYKPKTTFWQDFSIAERFDFLTGSDGSINDTFQRAFKEWRNNHVYLTEMVMVLNHKLGIWYSTAQKAHNEGQARLAECAEFLYKAYLKAYETAYEWGCEHLRGEKLKYFYDVLD